MDSVSYLEQRAKEAASAPAHSAAAEHELLRTFFFAWEAMHAAMNDKSVPRNVREQAAQIVVDKAQKVRAVLKPTQQ